MRAPQITGAQLRAKTYTDAQTGALVYVSEADTAPAGQTVDVTSVGYYYFNGAAAINKWVPITLSAIEPWRNAADDSPATDNNQNIYQNGKVGIAKAHVSANDPDLSIGGNGRATFGMENNAAMAAKNASGAYEDFLIPRSSNGITFFDYGSGGMHIRNNAKSPTMYITDNNLVGINNPNPINRLDVKSIAPGNAFRMDDTTQGEGKVLTSDANGKAQWKEIPQQLKAPSTEYPLVLANIGPTATPDKDHNSAITVYPGAPFAGETGWYSLRSRWFVNQNTVVTEDENYTGHANPGAGSLWLVITSDHSTAWMEPSIIYEFRATVNNFGISPPSGGLIYLEKGVPYAVKMRTRFTEYPITGERKLFVTFVQ